MSCRVLAFVSTCDCPFAADPVDPEMEPDTAQQETQEPGQEQEEEDDADPVMLAKKQKQLAKRGVTFQAKVDPKVTCWLQKCDALQPLQYAACIQRGPLLICLVKVLPKCTTDAEVIGPTRYCMCKSGHHSFASRPQLATKTRLLMPFAVLVHSTWYSRQNTSPACM